MHAHKPLYKLRGSYNSDVTAAMMFKYNHNFSTVGILCKILQTRCLDLPFPAYFFINSPIKEQINPRNPLYRYTISYQLCSPRPDKKEVKLLLVQVLSSTLQDYEMQADHTAWRRHFSGI